ncbi:MAG: hypothetical protein K2N73_17630 [Lachnospiraceae bacterium]|nr:hypothetical protein [Lachnospiraceae bacterium]
MRRERDSDSVLYILSAMIGVVAFIAIYGLNVLNPVYDDWLLGQGDLTQHYLGWCFYRRGDWTFPVGLTDNLAYPSFTSVIFTDSIPFLAVFFKVLSPVLPDTFQYFGWWGIASFALHGFFSAKILRAFSVKKMQTLIGSVFFVVSPLVIERMFKHTALGGHWMILASIYVFVRHGKDYRNCKKTILCWGILGALTPAVHLYFLPMCGAFLCGYILCGFIKEKRLQWKLLLPGISFGSMLFVSTYLLGGFSTRAVSNDKGLGECSFNLNGFFNEKGYSRFFHALPMYHELQYEGFAYLGLGIFVLISAAAAFLIIELTKNRSRCIRKNWAEILTGVLAAFGLVVFAASPVVTWNDRLLFVLTDSSTLTHYWSIFRSTGRMIWPVNYLIYIIAIVCNAKLWEIIFDENRHRYKNTAAAVGTVVIAVCCLLQIADISGKLAEQRVQFAPKKTYDSPFQDDIWRELAERESLRHLVWVPNSFENKEILALAKWAHDNMLTMNNFYFARGIGVAEDTQSSLHNPDDTYLFVFVRDMVQEYADCGLHFYEADGYIVGTTFELEQEEYDFDAF